MRRTNFNNQFFYPISLSVLYFLGNFMLMQNAHFHEDAYILFVYVENLVDNGVITYFPSGMPTEGVTDFLWMILVSALCVTGIDVGTSVILLNTIGVFIISLIVYQEAQKITVNHFLVKFLKFFLPLIWIIQHFFTASIGGFSVNLYMALILLAYMSLLNNKYLRFAPYLGLTVALFRPDGVILGVGFALIGSYISYKQNELKKYVVSIAISVFIGLIYFGWRYYYFGNLLPLPLYVKSSVDGLPGIGSNLGWIKQHIFIIGIVLFLSFYLKLAKKYFVLALPSIILFIMLLTAEQTQNIGFRFQAPMFIVLYFTLVIFLKELINRTNNSAFAKTTIILLSGWLLILGAKSLNNSYQHFSTFSYINEFPQVLNKRLQDRKRDNIAIALTEAGRIAYWNQSNNTKIYDLVGLNSEYSAMNTIDLNYINLLSPDVLMYHQASELKIDDFVNMSSRVLDLNASQLESKNNYKNREAISKVSNASVAATKFLQKYGDAYNIMLVDYDEDKSFSHVYAFKKNLNISDTIKEDLLKIFKKQNIISYYEMRNTDK